MKKLHHFKKINSNLLPVKTYFSKITLIVIAVWVITIASLGVNAQDMVTGTLKGTVIDSFTGKPISGVEVRFIYQDNGLLVASRFTDDEGVFSRSALPAGVYVIQFKASGYQSLQTVYTLYATKINEIIPPPALNPVAIKYATPRKPITGVRSSPPRKINPKPMVSKTGNLAVASVPNAEIIVEDLENGQIYKNKILSNEFLCVFDRLPPKKYLVSATLEGYKPLKKEIEILANQTFPLTLNLLPNETSSRILSQVGKYYALVIGNNDYKHLPKLNTAETDAKAVNSILQKRFGFETKLLLNATREQIIVALNEYRKIGPDDNLIIYYAGHGYNDTEVEKAYWLPVDARTEDNANWISADDITINVKRLNARHVLIISDSCYSGTISRGSDLVYLGSKPTEREKYLLKMNDGKSRTLLASGGNEPVTDIGGGIHSVFAAAFLTGLLEMDKDIFTAEELYYNFVKEKVAGKAEQTPEYNPLRNSGHESGDFIFIHKK